MKKSADMERYVEQLTGCQHKLYGYIYSLTNNVEQAKDVLQETNHKLWQLMDTYDPTREFLPWALRVAYNQVRTSRKRHQRERLVFHEEETLHAIADEYPKWAERSNARALALEVCMGKLAPDQRELVEAYYHGGSSLETIAASLNRRANSVAVTLHRIRQSLADCVRRTLS